MYSAIFAAGSVTYGPVAGAQELEVELLQPLEGVEVREQGAAVRAARRWSPRRGSDRRVKQTLPSRKQTWSSAWPGRRRPPRTAPASIRPGRRASGTAVRVVAMRVGQQDPADPAALVRLLPDGRDVARVGGARVDHVGRVRATT